MPGSAGNAIRAGRAFIELFADDRKLVRGLRKAQARLKAVAAGVRSMGTKLLTAASAIPAPLPLLVAAAFLQYVLDSRALAGSTLQASMLGRGNGICYFILTGLAILWELP